MYQFLQVQLTCQYGYNSLLYQFFQEHQSIVSYFPGTLVNCSIFSRYTRAMYHFLQVHLTCQYWYNSVLYQFFQEHQSIEPYFPGTLVNCTKFSRYTSEMYQFLQVQLTCQYGYNSLLYQFFQEHQSIVSYFPGTLVNCTIFSRYTSEMYQFLQVHLTCQYGYNSLLYQYTSQSILQHFQGTLPLFTVRRIVSIGTIVYCTSFPGTLVHCSRFTSPIYLFLQVHQTCQCWYIQQWILPSTLVHCTSFSRYSSQLYNIFTVHKSNLPPFAGAAHLLVLLQQCNVQVFTVTLVHCT